MRPWQFFTYCLFVCGVESRWWSLSGNQQWIEKLAPISTVSRQSLCSIITSMAILLLFWCCHMASIPILRDGPTHGTQLKKMRREGDACIHPWEWKEILEHLNFIHEITAYSRMYEAQFKMIMIHLIKSRKICREGIQLEKIELVRADNCNNNFLACIKQGPRRHMELILVSNGRPY